MRNTKPANIPLYKLILPDKITFDGFHIEYRKPTVPSPVANSTNGGTLELYFHNEETMIKIYHELFGEFRYKTNRQIDLLFVYSDCSSMLYTITGIHLDELKRDTLELHCFFDWCFVIHDPEEATAYIREIKLKSLLE